MKRANWKAIVPQKMSEDSFWVKVNKKEDDEKENLASKDILDELASKFSSKPVKKTTEKDSTDRPMTIKKSVLELRVLDAKSAQNISILLGGSLKHLSYDEIKIYLLRCDTSNLNASILQQMIQYLPPPDQLKKLQELKASGVELSGECHFNLEVILIKCCVLGAEKFAATIAEIRRIGARLQSLSFRLNFPDLILDVKPDIYAVLEACKEIRESKEFAQILELILLFGNFMNTGSKNEAAYGFEISFLTKLTSTKDYENKQTLLHYLVEIVEQKHPKLLDFHKKLENVDKASRVSLDNIQKTVRQMQASLKNLESDLNNNKVPQGPDDKFIEVMAEFTSGCREQVENIVIIQTQMEKKFKALAEYFAFDTNKYSVEEFFSDIKTFKDNFIQAYQDNLKIREIEAKAKRAQEAKESHQKLMQEKNQTKKNHFGINMDSGNHQEGIMDSLLEALETGSAFANQRKKRGARPAGKAKCFLN